MSQGPDLKASRPCSTLRASGALWLQRTKARGNKGSGAAQLPCGCTASGAHGAILVAILVATIRVSCEDAPARFVSLSRGSVEYYGSLKPGTLTGMLCEVTISSAASADAGSERGTRSSGAEPGPVTA